MYDVAIIGGGVSGLGASIYAARFNLKTIIFDKNFGGLIKNTHVVENYPGFSSLSGPELAKNIENHARNYKEFIDFKVEVVAEIENKETHFLITTNKGDYQARTIIFSIGSKHRILNVPGEKKFLNKGVSYCALCDGPLFKDKIVGVVGGSDSAAKEALLLSEYAKKVYIIYRKEKIRANTNITEIYGRDFVEGVRLDTNQNELKLDGLFIEIGNIVKAEIAKSLGVELNEEGEIIINERSETNVKGIYASGDCTNFSFKQAITGVAQGVTAVYSAYKYIKG